MAKRPSVAQEVAAAPKEYRSIDIDAARPHPKNPRVHGSEQIKRLQAALEQFGQTKPILVRKEDMTIIAGHGVREAARNLGWSKLDALILDVTPRAAMRIMIGDNRLADMSKTDDDMLRELLQGMSEDDWMGTGYTAAEASKLFEKVTGEDLVIHEIDTTQAKEDFWISVRGPLALQADALQRVRTLMADLPGLAVEIGTTEG